MTNQKENRKTDDCADEICLQRLLIAVGIPMYPPSPQLSLYSIGTRGPRAPMGAEKVPRTGTLGAGSYLFELEV